ncbi:MAG: 30S ribosomal protein S14 [Gammaproteobacteria bacterium]|nr:MAG: 30S ribosomal protein S14 [Gammaproteobacteria bacterium]
MAKLSMIQREIKRQKCVDKYAEKRAALKARAYDMTLTPEERMEARKKFHALPRNASPVRLQRRCSLTGRPHGVYRRFGLSRNKLRKIAMRGEVPGLVKSSW